MKKNAQIANFNIVFGEKEEPMLDYFDTVIYPAFTSDLKRVSDGNEYLFKNLKISEGVGNKYVLTGQFVKKTILEIKSDINEKKVIASIKTKNVADFPSFLKTKTTLKSIEELVELIFKSGRYGGLFFTEETRDKIKKIDKGELGKYFE